MVGLALNPRGYPAWPRKQRGVDRDGWWAVSGHTVGPWMVASHPSSVVGLPVVARPSGRSIASVTFFSLGEAFANHDRESQANAHLIAAAPDLLMALERSKEGWENAIELDLIPERHKDTAVILADEARAAIAKARGDA